jgi:ABC-type branched-chain amino acid transport system, permease component
MSFLQDILQNRKKTMILIVVAAIVLALLIPSLAGNQFILNLTVMIFIYALLASSWNIIGGYAGQLSTGHAAYFGIGAYTVVLLNVRLGISPWIGLPVAMLLAATLAVLVGWPCFRLKGSFFTLSTIAVLGVLRVLAVNLTGLTFGSVGVSVPMTFGFANMLFSSKWAYLLITGIALGCVLFFKHWMQNSKLGYYLVAIREDQDAASSLGVNASRIKLISFAVSAAFTAVGGAIYAQFILYIDPVSVFSSNISLQMVIMSVIGGLGTLWGPLLGAALMVPMDQLIRAYFGGRMQGMSLLIYSLILILVIRLMPRGIAPTVKDWVNKPNRSKKKEVGGASNE